MSEEKLLINSSEFELLMDRLTFQILEHNKGSDDTYIVGIKRRGEYIAKRIVEKANKYNQKSLNLSIIDITLYRDDLSEVSSSPDVKTNNLDFDVNGKSIVLVDDVLFTGRTIYSAIDMILKQGRPKEILIAVVVDRGHKELPIHAEFVGKYIPTKKSEVIHVKVKEIDNCDDCVTIKDRGEK